MKLVLLFGPQAVGKMTVGQELEKSTELKLFHNHMTLELLQPYFGFSKETFRLSNLFRKEFFEAFSKSNQYGLIFTYLWALDLQEDWDYVDELCHCFESKGAEVYFVELEADVDERLKRNKTANRLEHKPSKRNVEQSESNLLQTMEKHRLNSIEGEITRKNYLRINNTNYSAAETVNLIKETFGL